MRPVAARVHSLIGSDRDSWKTERLAYHAIVYRQLFEGVDLGWDCRTKYVKSELLLAPYADLSAVRFRYESSARPELNARGDLVIGTQWGLIVESAPQSYQEVRGRRVPVPTAFQLHEDGTIGFSVGPYDRSRSLIIDPEISYSSLVGGNQFEAVTSVASDAAGNAYFAGWTESSNVTTSGAYQPSSRGRVEAFFGKMSPTGALVFLTYFGGTGNDRAAAIAVDPSGTIYVAGSTDSSDFPVRNAFQTGRRGAGTDSFVARFSASGSALIYSTYLGGSAPDSATGIAVDSQGSAYVAGQSSSSDFPLRNPLQLRFGGLTDAFVVKVDSAGAMVYSTYLGGSGNDSASSIAVNAVGEAYLAGSTESVDFPVTAGGYQRALRGGQDAFSARLNATASALIFSTYYGGGGGSIGAPEFALGIALDPDGGVWLTGVTSSADLPLSGPLQPALAGGGMDGFAAKFNSIGSSLQYATYLGGSGADIATAIAVDTSGSVYVAGYATSVDLPLASAIQATSSGSYDAFLFQFRVGGALSFGTYLGGTNSDAASAITLAGGDVVVAGYTLSYDFPRVASLPVSNPDNYAGFVSRFRLGSVSAPVAASIFPGSGSGNAGSSQTFVLNVRDAAGAANIQWAQVLINPRLSGGQGCWIGYDPINRLFFMTNDTASAWVLGSSSTISNSQCSLNIAAASAVSSGNTLTLSLPITFDANFSGNKLLMADVVNRAGLDSGWQILGTWRVLRPNDRSPSAGTIAPLTSSGSRGIFTVTLSDPDGYRDLAWSEMIFNTSLNGRLACYITYDPQYHLFNLADDVMGSWVLPNGAGALENSQCIVFPLAAVTSAQGTNRTLTFPIAFKSPLLGSISMFIHTIDGTGVDSGWAFAGGWTVTPNVAPAAISAAQGGLGVPYRFNYSDADGAADIVWAEILVNSGLDGRHACYVMLDPVRGKLYLANDAYNGYSGVVDLGAASTAQNSQCAINGSGSSVSSNGLGLTLALTMTPTPAFWGSKRVYMRAVDSRGVDSGWLDAGGWVLH
jgi:hypothetical protein